MRFKGRQKIDLQLAAAIFGLAAFGLLMLYSASSELSRVKTGSSDNSTYFLMLQLVSFGMGIVALIILQQVNYHIFQKKAWLWAGLTFLLLASVNFFSKGAVNGAHRWISIAGQSFQPSEIAKLALILFLADWFSSQHRNISTWQKGFAPFLAVIGVMSLLMLQQHDLGSLAVMLVIAVTMYGMSGARVSQIGVTIGSLVAIAYAAIRFEPYRMQRLLTFLNSDTAASQGAGYQISQAKISIGLGGWLGRGFLQGTQKKGFLPEAHTDSIFAVIVEELGYIRSALVILVFAFIGYRGMQIARKAGDHFGSMLAIGITTWIVAQAFINIAAMVSLIPLTGVPLPFISYGRTAMIALFMAVGVLLNVSRYVERE